MASTPLRIRTRQSCLILSSILATLVPPAKASEAKELDIGLLSREYEPLREVGRGGMGRVVLARHRIARHEIAIKISSPGAIDGVEALARLQREARVLSSLRHPNIVRLYDLVDIGRGRIAIVMEYVRGTSLADVLQRDGGLPFDRCHSILLDVAAALAHAHGRGVVHRDVKPSNVLLNRESWSAKLCDFGIARGAPGDVAVTAPEIISGTPAYMSPEHIDGLTLDARSDVYSLGLVAWEIVTGEQPWRGLPMFDVLYRQKRAMLPDVDTLRAGVPSALSLTIEGALAKVPALRWRDIDEMTAQLLSAEPTERLLELREERFAHEVESRARETIDDGAGRPSTSPRRRIAIAGDPATAPDAGEGAGASNLPATVQMRLPDVPPEIPRSALSLLAEPTERDAQRESTSDGGESNRPIPTVAAASPATVPVPSPISRPQRERVTEGGVQPTPPAPLERAPSPPVAALPTFDPPAGEGGAVPAEEGETVVGDLASVLRADRDRRVRGTLALAIALVTAVTLAWTIWSSTNPARDHGTSSESAPGAIAGGPAAPPLPVLLPGVRERADASDSAAAIAARVVQTLANDQVESSASAPHEGAVRGALLLESVGELAAAERVLDDAVARFPRVGVLYAQRARVRASGGRVREAWTDVELARRTGAEWDVLVTEALLILQRDGRGAARARLNPVVRSLVEGDALVPPPQAVGVARALVVTGDQKMAMAILRRMAPLTSERTSLLDDPYLDPLASDPQFAAMRLRAVSR